MTKKVIALIGSEPVQGAKSYRARLGTKSASRKITLSDTEVDKLEQTLDDLWLPIYQCRFSNTEHVVRQALTEKPDSTACEILRDAFQEATQEDIDDIAYVLTMATSSPQALHLVCMLDLFSVATGIVIVKDSYGKRSIPGNIFFSRF